MQSICPRGTIDQWLNGLRIGHKGHFLAAKRANHAHLWLGCTTATLGIITATAVFSNLTNDPHAWVQVIAGAISLLTVSLAVIQTFLNLPGSAAAHRTAATNYGSLRRRLEQELLQGQPNTDFLTQLRDEWDRMDRNSPELPPDIYDRVFREVTAA